MGFSLGYGVSVELVVGAAREYFNSAASMMDREMDLARCVCVLCTEATSL